MESNPDNITSSSINRSENIFLSQFRIIYWKLCLTARRRYIRTLLCLIAPIFMVAMFRYGFYKPIEPPKTCANEDVVPKFVTLDIYTSFGYLLHVLLIVHRLLEEKYNQRRTLLFVMGCMKSSYYISNLLFDLMTTLFMGMYLAFSLRYLLLTCSYLPFLVISYLLHSLQTVGLAYAFCYNCIYNTDSQPPATWITIFLLVWTISKTLRIVLEFQLGTPTGIVATIITIFNCMIPQPALFETGKHIIFNKSLRFDGLFSDETFDDLLPLGFMWCSMFASIVIFFMISWFSLRDDHESEVSLFKKGKIDGDRTTPDQQLYSQTDTYLALDKNNLESIVNLSQIFRSDLLLEDEPTHLFRGITVKNASKSYPSKTGDGRIKVVDNLSLSVYEGQITILLGPNGAGKTTLIELITGLLESNSGAITVAGRQSNNKENRYLARLSVGYCPQLSIVFSDLTVREHLELFCGIKCFQSSDKIRKLIRTILESVRLVDKEDSLVHTLSGGMVRKLSLAIALVGDKHQVLILDEPSSGLDPESRESIWNIIQKYGRSKAILITTQHMEEADHLGDRIAIMSRGRIVCFGSNVFLKNLLGNGYLIRLALNANPANLDQDIRLEQHTKIKRYMRDMFSKCLIDYDTLHTQNKLRNGLRLIVKQISEAIHQQSSSGEIDDGQDITIALDSLYKMPHNQFNAPLPLLDYEKFFLNLEKSQSTLHIESFGIASSTMEDVFNNVSVMANICFGKGIPRLGNKLLIPVFSEPTSQDDTRIMAIDQRSTIGGDSIDPIQFNATSNDKITGSQLILRHVNVTFRRHLIIFWNNLGSFIGQRVLYLILVYLVMVIIVRVRSTQRLDLQKEITKFTFYSTLPFFLAFMGSHFIHISNRDKIIDGSKFLQHMAGLHPVIYWTVQYLFDLPSMILNAIILIYCMKWIDFTVPFSDNPYFTTTDIWISMSLLVVGFSSASALLSYSVSGYFTTSAMALVGMAMYHTATFFLACGAIIFSTYSDYGYNLYVYWATLLNPGFALVDGIRKYYNAAYYYEVIVNDYNRTKNIYANITQFNDTARLVEELKKTSRKIKFDTLDPKYLERLFNSTNDADLLNRTQDQSMLFSSDIQHGIYINYGSILLWNFLGMLWLILDEYDCNPIDLIDRFCRLFVYHSVRANSCFSSIISTTEEQPSGTMNKLKSLFTIDPSVEREKVRVDTLMARPASEDSSSSRTHRRLLSLAGKQNENTSHKSSGGNRKAVVLPLLAGDLRKSYGDILAVESLSLALNYEECLGLLGINGAGKTTTFSMISTKIRQDRGQLRCMGYSPNNQRRRYRQQIGYDPQMSVTFYDLTCRQTLRHMALLRGMSERAINQAVDSLLMIFDMEEHADKLMNELSGGTKRKLSLALAMICTPPVLLLDEPTAGVDPLARRSIWECISSCKRRHNCSIIISSHAMEECEAICDRIALMANGNLYCLGSFQQLRKKYSQGYVIRVQLYKLHRNEADQPQITPSPPEIVVANKISDELTSSLKSQVPSLSIDYHSHSIIIYRIKDPNVPRSTLFKCMERESQRYAGQISFLINDTSLEDVFLTFARCFDSKSRRFSQESYVIQI